MVSLDQHHVGTAETLKHSICARNTFQSLLALLLSLSKDCRASWSSPRLIPPPYFTAVGDGAQRPLGPTPTLTCRTLSPQLLAPCAAGLPSHWLRSQEHLWAPSHSTCPLSPTTLQLPKPGCPPTGEGEAAGVDANQRSQPRTAVAPRLTHSPKLNTHYTKLIDIN